MTTSEYLKKLRELEVLATRAVGTAAEARYLEQAATLITARHQNDTPAQRCRLERAIQREFNTAS